MNKNIIDDLNNRNAKFIAFICEVDEGSQLLSYDEKGNVNFISPITSDGLMVFAKNKRGTINLLAEVG